MPRSLLIPCLRASAFGLSLAATAVLAQTQSGTNIERAPAGRLRLVAEFPHQVTGVTVSENGRIFVNFPRWTDDAPVSVAEVTKDGKTLPFPNVPWNSWRNAKKDEIDAGKAFVCVQSVVADQRGSLWVLDAAAPAMGFEVPGGPKLVQIDLAKNEVARIVAFDETIAPQGSYLNDVRFSPGGEYAYITDSGVKGAIVVVDLKTGKARRLLDGDPSTQADQTVMVKADGQVLRRPDGRGVEFSADGIALSTNGDTLYWQAIKGKTLYSVPVTALQDETLPSAAVTAAVSPAGENGVADGLLISKNGRMYITAPEENAVKARDGNNVTTVVRDDRLRWPDTLAEGPGGEVYVTSSRIQDSAFFKPGAPASLPTQLWRIENEPSRPADITERK